MASDANDRLVEAVEAGRLDAVSAALRDGADPNAAAKRVTLSVKLGRAVKTETLVAEPALALAIRTGRAEVVKALLDAGCDPNRPMQWSVPEYWDPWTLPKWEKNRWRRAPLSSPNALDFALNSGGPHAFNAKGAAPVISNPSLSTQCSQSFFVTPSVEIVTMLLQRGAVIAESTFELARGLKEGKNKLGNSVYPRPEFLKLLEGHLRSPQTPPAPASGGFITKLSSALVEQQRISSDQAHTNEQLTAQLADLTGRYEGLQKALHGQLLSNQLKFIKELVDRNSELEQMVRDRDARLRAAEAANAAIREDAGHLAAAHREAEKECIESSSRIEVLESHLAELEGLVLRLQAENAELMADSVAAENLANHMAAVEREIRTDPDWITSFAVTFGYFPVPMEATGRDDETPTQAQSPAARTPELRRTPSGGMSTPPGTRYSGKDRQGMITPVSLPPTPTPMFRRLSRLDT